MEELNEVTVALHQDPKGRLVALLTDLATGVEVKLRIFMPTRADGAYERAGAAVDYLLRNASDLLGAVIRETRGEPGGGLLMFSGPEEPEDG